MNDVVCEQCVTFCLERALSLSENWAMKWTVYVVNEPLDHISKTGERTESRQ